MSQRMAGRPADPSADFAIDRDDLLATRSVWRAMWNGTKARCPACGDGGLYDGFIKVADACPTCGEALHHHRADDAPPYIVMMIVGHVVIAIMLLYEMMMTPQLWLHAAIFLPMTVVMSLLLMRPVKGMLVGLQWANLMHGFDPDYAGGDA
ncbi:DUF983 domain-containing protein [Acuticoccus sp. I52.16.1]|uniref:DUF983 domain-containing protein n=1 Tax=Acuticoccus sp. I52.16.1 TaxID=2928472 RepID=UPI001FD61B7C|nr:DUF983 domain-containing protein [Acuticoccus sp. I52.16.1]UOM35434.1 DUF983 domain-containing protein [Acuticoccus sp. I52.16.1]